jgi:hypothetical protein
VESSIQLEAVILLKYRFLSCLVKTVDSNEFNLSLGLVPIKSSKLVDSSITTALI